MTVIALDIDGVLAREGNAYASYVNTSLSLGISEEALKGIHNNEQFIKMPEVRAYVGKGPEWRDRFQTVFHEAQYAAEVQEQNLVIDGAVEAVNRLAEKCTITYVTNRKTETSDVTRAWLRQAGFPNTDRLHCCFDAGGFAGKIRSATSYLARTAERLYFIDDMPAELERAYWRFVQLDIKTATPLLMHSAILAYGHTQLPPCPHSMPVIIMAALPIWSGIEESMADCRPYFNRTFRDLLSLFDEDCKSTLYRKPLNQRRIA